MDDYGRESAVSMIERDKNDDATHVMCPMCVEMMPEGMLARHIETQHDGQAAGVNGTAADYTVMHGEASGTVGTTDDDEVVDAIAERMAAFTFAVNLLKPLRRTGFMAEEAINVGDVLRVASWLIDGYDPEQFNMLPPAYDPEPVAAQAEAPDSYPPRDGKWYARNTLQWDAVSDPSAYAWHAPHWPVRWDDDADAWVAFHN